MTEWIILAGLVIALTLCSLLVSFYAIYRAHGLSYKTGAAVEAARAECAAAVEAVNSKLESMAATLHESSQRPSAEPLPGEPRSCMNLTRRSQALRLRRKGDTPQQIAESLRIPRQEVDLLIKVHDIVVSNL